MLSRGLFIRESTQWRFVLSRYGSPLVELSHSEIAHRRKRGANHLARCTTVQMQTGHVRKRDILTGMRIAMGQMISGVSRREGPDVYHRSDCALEHARERASGPAESVAAVLDSAPERQIAARAFPCAATNGQSGNRPAPCDFSSHAQSSSGTGVMRHTCDTPHQSQFL